MKRLPNVEPFIKLKDVKDKFLINMQTNKPHNNQHRKYKQTNCRGHMLISTKQTKIKPKEIINWFKSINNKKECYFGQLDIKRLIHIQYIVKQQSSKADDD